MRHTGMNDGQQAAPMPGASDAGTCGRKGLNQMETPNSSTPQTGNAAPGDAAPQQPTNDNPNVNPAVTPVGQTPAAPVESDEVRGLKAAAEAERKKRQELENQLTQQQLFLQQLAQQQQAQAARPPVQPQPLEVNYLEGFTSSDMMDPDKVIQGVNKAVRRAREEVLTAANQTIEQLRFQMEFPDFQSLVGQHDPLTGQFRYSETLQEALNEDPKLVSRIMRSADPKTAAYEVALKQKQIRALRQAQQAAAQTVQQQQQAQAQAQAAARNAANTAAAMTAPMSPASVSGVTAQPTDRNWDAALTDPAVGRQFDAWMDEVRSGKHG